MHTSDECFKFRWQRTRRLRQQRPHVASKWGEGARLLHTKVSRHYQEGGALAGRGDEGSGRHGQIEAIPAGGVETPSKIVLLWRCAKTTTT